MKFRPTAVGNYEWRRPNRAGLGKEVNKTTSKRVGKAAINPAQANAMNNKANPRKANKEELEKLIAFIVNLYEPGDFNDVHEEVYGRNLE